MSTGQTEIQFKQLFNAIALTTDPETLASMFENLRKLTGPYYYAHLKNLLNVNPNLVLSEDDFRAMRSQQGLEDLLLLKQQVIAMPGRRVAVFCMPKSGSSFTQSAIQAAIKLPFQVLTTHGSHYSQQGMNGREQELCELSVMAAILRTQGNFIAQHHTKCTPYLCAQLRTYNLKPIVTVRNVFDAIVSFDDMMCEWRHQGTWQGDGSHTLPVTYPSMPTEKRLGLLAANFGVWLVNFYVTWRRCERAGMVQPLWISYERDLLDKEVFKDKVASYLVLTDTERNILATYVDKPDAGRARLNKGIAGRGAAVPTEIRVTLMAYAENFRDELDEMDWKQLFGA